ncbi:MAG TPA: hypothetical protein VNU01_01385 [Egibacteraceae bacterium]|nr:hypothetical protein [Egibacteraceae bacterium]
MTDGVRERQEGDGFDPVLGEAPGAAVGRDRYRPVFAELQVFPGPTSTEVDVTLSLGGRVVTSRAQGPGDERGVAHTAAEAALSALGELLDGRATLELAWFKVLEPDGHFGHVVLHTAVACRSERGRDLYVGSALSRGDLAVAAVRSALDAMNRPFARLLAEG